MRTANALVAVQYGNTTIVPIHPEQQPVHQLQAQNAVIPCKPETCKSSSLDNELVIKV